MERYNKRIEDKNLNDITDFIFNNAFGNPIILSAVPTAAQMKANTWGKFGTNIYVKFADNVLLRFSGTVIS